MTILTRQEIRAARKDVEPAQPTKHSVNLLPPETVERQRARALLRRFVFAVLALLVVGAGVWLAQASAIQSANDELTAAQSDLASARSRLEPLQAVKAFSASLDGQQQLVGESMARHTSFSRTLQGFAAAFPQGTEARALWTWRSGLPAPARTPSSRRRPSAASPGRSPFPARRRCGS